MSVNMDEVNQICTKKIISITINQNEKGKSMVKFICLFFLLIISFQVNAQWIQVWNGMGQDKSVSCLNYKGNKLFAGLANNTGGLYTSTNEGLSWNPTTLDNAIYTITINNSDIYASQRKTAGGCRLYKSIDNGTTWNIFSEFSYSVYSLIFKAPFIFAGFANKGVSFTTNNGSNWVQTYLDNRTVNVLLLYNNILFAGTSDYGIYLSTDNGSIWSQTSLNNKYILSMCTMGQNIYAGSRDGIYCSTNNGNNWTQIYTSTKYITSIFSLNNVLFASQDAQYSSEGGVIVSTNSGISWSDFSTGLNNKGVLSLCSTTDYIIAGTESNSVFRRPQSEIIGIIHISTLAPDIYSLHQNYPNPFNPITKIKFEIPESINVKITVLDVLGRVVETLVNDKLSLGKYETTWNGSKFSNGIYFCRLQTDNFNETKCMILLK